MVNQFSKNLGQHFDTYIERASIMVIISNCLRKNI